MHFKSWFSFSFVILLTGGQTLILYLSNLERYSIDIIQQAKKDNADLLVIKGIMRQAIKQFEKQINLSKNVENALFDYK